MGSNHFNLLSHLYFSFYSFFHSLLFSYFLRNGRFNVGAIYSDFRFVFRLVLNMFSVFLLSQLYALVMRVKISSRLSYWKILIINYLFYGVWSYCSFYIVVHYFVVHRFTVVPLCLPCVVFMLLFKTAAYVGGESKNKNLIRGFCYGKSFWYNICIYLLKFELFSFLRIPLSTIRYFMSFCPCFDVLYFFSLNSMHCWSESYSTKGSLFQINVQDCRWYSLYIRRGSRSTAQQYGGECTFL